MEVSHHKRAGEALITPLLTLLVQCAVGEIHQSSIVPGTLMCISALLHTPVPAILLCRAQACADVESGKTLAALGQGPGMEPPGAPPYGPPHMGPPPPYGRYDYVTRMHSSVQDSGARTPPMSLWVEQRGWSGRCMGNFPCH